MLLACRPLLVMAAVIAVLCPASDAGAGEHDNGAEAYRARCAVCHGEGGRGDGVMREALKRAPSDLTAHACLLHTGLSSGARWTFRRAGRAHAARVRGRLSANNSEALCTLACEGLGIARLASWLVDGPIAEGRLVPLLPEFELPSAPIQALLSPGRWVHPRVRAFVDHMHEAMSATFAEG